MIRVHLSRDLPLAEREARHHRQEGVEQGEECLPPLALGGDHIGRLADPVEKAVVGLPTALELPELHGDRAVDLRETRP